MKKCKNDDCENLIDDKRIYCSLKCRNIYVNKNLRDYTKNSKSLKEKEKKKEEKYYKTPKKCKECGKIIPYNKKNNNFCNNSCSAIYTNINRDKVNHFLSEKGYNNIKKANRKIARDKFFNEKIEYYSNKKRCDECNKIIPYNHRTNIFCNIRCRKIYYTKNVDDFKLYRSLSNFKFNLKDFEEEYDFDLIKKYGWYKAKNRGDNENGVSRDHMFSVNDGFKNMINPLLLAHPANCKLIINKKNQSKNVKSSLTIEELLDNVKKFDNKYGSYYKNEIKIDITLDDLKKIYAG